MPPNPAMLKALLKRLPMAATAEKGGAATAGKETSLISDYLSKYSPASAVGSKASLNAAAVTPNGIDLGYGLTAPAYTDPNGLIAKGVSKAIKYVNKAAGW